MLLGIDTSGAVSAAVARGQLTAAGSDGTGIEVLAVRSDTRARHHDEVLLTLIDEVVSEAGITRQDLSGVVVGRGPGPFTGLRVGLVAARSIAAVLGIPLVGVCSLDALAHQALAADARWDGPAPQDRTAREVPEGHRAEGLSIGVALDARRREVYHARYRALADGTPLRESGPDVAPPAEVAAELTACDLLVGSGTALYPELLPATADLSHVDAGHLIEVAALLLQRGEDLSSTEPLYLRAPDAAKPSARKSALGR